MQRRALCKARGGHRADKGGARAGEGWRSRTVPIWRVGYGVAAATLAPQKKKRPEVSLQTPYNFLWPGCCRAILAQVHEGWNGAIQPVGSPLRLREIGRTHSYGSV